MATKYAYFSPTANNYYYFYGSTWMHIMFTAPATHDITYVVLYLSRYGSPGTITVSIRDSSSSMPDGGDLCSGTTNGNTLNSGSTAGEWRTITFASSYRLTAGTNYHIVVRATGGNFFNTGYWRMNDGGYVDGVSGRSTNSGSSWTNWSTGDCLFEEWGNPVGWTTISRIDGVLTAGISRANNSLLTSISRVNGVLTT
jgi:hypothetical protein